MTFKHLTICIFFKFAFENYFIRNHVIISKSGELDLRCVMYIHLTGGVILKFCVLDF